MRQGEEGRHYCFYTFLPIHYAARALCSGGQCQDAQNAQDP